MNERIKELAEQAKFAMNVSNDPNSPPSWWAAGHNDTFEKFAALVAAAEREACAKLCDEKVDAEYKTGKVDHNEMGWTQACAIAIRARGER
jgi:hypothetical protein